MKRNDDFIDQLEGYLDEYEGSTPLPEGVRDAVRAQLPSIQQRPAWRLGWRFPEVNGLAKLVAAAALLVVALVGFRFLVPGTNLGELQPTASPTLRATPGELPAAAALAPGTYSMPNPYSDQDPVRSCESGCADYRGITFTLPEGWATSDGLVYKHRDQPNEVAFSAWTVDQVYADPCHWRGSALTELDLNDGQTHEAFHDAHAAGDGSVVRNPRNGGLANQLGRNASALIADTLGGQPALRIELSVPANLDTSTCDEGEFRSWTEWDVVDGANSHHAPGQIDVVYMVDVDRRPLVIDASHMPAASEEDLAELDAILAGMIIVRDGEWRPGSSPTGP